VTLLFVGALGACAPGRPLAPSLAATNDSVWLIRTGFPLREPDALLHLDRAEISTLRVDSVSQVLARAPRVEVRLRRDGRKEYLLHRTDGWDDPGCALDFYVNGSLLQMRVGDILELQRDRIFEPHQLNGLEIFAAADAPVGDATGCGAVLMWVGRLRERDDPPFTAALHGQIVRLPDRQGVAGVPVRVEPGALRRVTDERGRFDFGHVPAARYRIETDVPGWGMYRDEFGLRSGATAELLIEVDGR
jgi:hypothetical protein